MTALAAFDAAPTEAVDELLRPCCASPAWRQALLAGRPFGSLADINARSDALIEQELPWSEIELALAAHPRIGERAAGADTESAWSRQEQSAAANGDAEALRAGNEEYETRFNHVFLVCATGRTGEEILADLRHRLGHDVGTEQRVVRGELSAIVRIRLAKALQEA